MLPSQITLVPHTHWDREWYLPFEVMRAQLVEMLDEALDHLERDPRLSFTLDGHVALVDDYLEMRPSAEPRVRALVTAGKLHIGPWFTQSDTMLPDGESLIRNLALGIRRAEALGGAMRVGYMPDQFGHAAQLPQILRMFDIDGAVLWRGVGPERPPSVFRWVGSDGSEVTVLWLQDGYGSGRRLPSDPEGFADAVDRTLARLGDWLGEMPVLLPVGDDHVRLAAWLPEAADAVRARHPEIQVTIGGYQHHLPHVGRPREIDHEIHGELRSPAFSPVLAGVASVRIREKQAERRAATLLERYAEPLWAMALEAGAIGLSTGELVRRGWQQLLLNHAHDSVAGCGVDSAHEDVKARYRWAEQLAVAARDQAIAQLAVAAPEQAPAHVVVFHPGPSAPFATVETVVPRSLAGALVAVGGDGIARPVQPLGAVEERPIFEGEFAAAELGQYLGGLDPATPLFGKFLQGITARIESPGLVRLDVGLGESVASPSVLAEDQRRVRPLLDKAERFKVAIHVGGVTRPVLLQAGHAPEVGLLSIVVRPGALEPSPTRARRVDGERPTIAAGSISIAAQPDGTVLIQDDRLGFVVRANDLVDEGDRGDLYHFDRAGGVPVRARAAYAQVIEQGPIRARLRIEQTLDLPVALGEDRAERSASTIPTTFITEVTLVAGERRVEFVTSYDNASCDHRLRAVAHVPLRADRIDVDHGLAVTERPLDPALTLGAGTERAALTGQHHLFVDLSDGKSGLALMSRGLPEHEVRCDRDGATELALTLVRSVGWLSRGDLKVIDHAAGPMVPTPGGQELGAHRAEYALLLHEGDWFAGDVLDDARRFAAPAIPITPRGTAKVPPDCSLVVARPKRVMLTALHPSETGRGTVVRLLNASPNPITDGTLETAFHVHDALEIDPLEQPVSSGRAAVALRDGTVHFTLAPWQLATILLRRETW